MNKTSVFAFTLIVLFALSIFAFQPAHASRTIVVPDDYSTIQEAIDNAVDGDTVFVRAGVYVESVVVNKAITLKGEGKGLTEVYGLSVETTMLVRRDGVTITGFTIDGGPDALDTNHTRGRLAGIHLLHVRNCQVFDNEVVDCRYGIWLYGASDNSVFSNSAVNNENGIIIDHASDNNITGNTVSNGKNGVKLSASWGNTLSKNSMTNNSYGFVVSGTDTTHYDNEVDSSNLVNGKSIYYLIYQRDQVLTPSSCPNLGVLAMVNCTGMTAQDFNIDREYFGILIINNMNTTVTRNSLSSNQFDIWLQFSSNCTVSANNMKSSTQAIQVEQSEDINITENTIDAAVNGITVTYSDGNRIAENFLTNIDNAAISLDSSANNVILKNQLTNDDWSISLSAASDNRIEANEITATTYEDNRVGYTGISIVNDGSDRNIIIGNTVVNQSGYGIQLSGSYYNEIVGNNVTGNAVSLGFLSSFRNIIKENNFTDSRQATISFSASSRSVFYNNNFITNQTLIDDIVYHRPAATQSENIWSNDTIGNYWSSYNGTDTDGDGRGDTPHVLDNKNKDSYPLMVPFTAPKPNPSPSPSTTETPIPSESPTIPEITPLGVLVLALATCLGAATFRKKLTGEI
ncbi:MAG: right-handed parallel beta-helix repeat-containing protein [Candidatus Bathyarchaeota archaeon]|nr:right-handed parallel beta-helix repeat-containing protein [Candidatus Bathyarchaeota archaeon]